MINDLDTFIFDFDLTLADSSAAIFICFRHTLGEFGYKIPSDEEIYKTIGLTLEDGFQQLCGVTDEQVKQQMRKCYVKKADDVMAAQTYFFDGAVETLAKLRSMGCKTGIVSTKYRYRIVETFEKQQKPLEVDMIIGSEDVSCWKPAPTGLNTIISKLGSQKDKTLYVGDSYIDAETAVNAGVAFAAVTTGSTSADVFKKYDTFVVCSGIKELFSKYIFI